MRLFLAVRAAAYATAFVTLWVWIAFSVRPLDERFGLWLPGWTPFVGWVLLSVGAALTAACVVLFVLRGRGTPAPFDAPRELVASGPYRYVRNPMYVGGLTALLGLALVLRSAAMVLLVLFAGALMHGFVVLYEEPALESRFGTSYLDYKRSVRRWIPRI